MNRTRLACAAIGIFATVGATTMYAWVGQGHRLVALVAATHLSAAARANVTWLLGDESLPDVAMWADEYISGNTQTAPWHYVNMPLEATAYDRNRDCPRQPGVQAGSRNDRWRDCIVDRILYHEERLANRALDRADRAIALKFLVHFVGDLHQPLHAVGVARGGNAIPVVLFESATCRYPDGTSFPCNLHGVWDFDLIAHRRLTDRQYLDELTRQIRQNRWDASPTGSPAEWALESHTLAKTVLLPERGIVDEAYYRGHIAEIDKRLAQAGLRLAAVLNRSLSVPPR